jgi:hypothetical protein
MTIRTQNLKSIKSVPKFGVVYTQTLPQHHSEAGCFRVVDRNNMVELKNLWVLVVSAMFASATNLPKEIVARLPIARPSIALAFLRTVWHYS